MLISPMEQPTNWVVPTGGVFSPSAQSINITFRRLRRVNREHETIFWAIERRDADGPARPCGCI